jgi:hypothetical protein
MSLINLKITLHLAWVITFAVLALALRDTLAGPVCKVLLVLTALNAVRLATKAGVQTRAARRSSTNAGQATL